MAAPVNEFDTRLQAEPKRTLAPRGGLILSATANLVTVAGGVGTPSVITLVATPLVVSGSVVFSTSPEVPLALDQTGLIATLRYADMGTSSVVVTATLTANGIPYTDSRTISQVSIGSLGYQGALDATRNNTAQGVLSARPAGSDGDFYFATDALVLYQKVAGAWRAAGNNFTNTNQLTDGAGLGQTAAWGSVSSMPGNVAALTGAEGINNTLLLPAIAAAAANVSFVPSLDDSTWSGAPTAAVTDGKVGATTRRSVTGAYQILESSVFTAIDRTRTYRVRFWARAAAGTDGTLYHDLRQYTAADANAPGSSNGGRDPYQPAVVAPHTDWRAYDFLWDASVWRTGTTHVKPDFLLNYQGTAGYWEVQGYSFLDVTESVKAQAAADAANAAITAISSDNVLSKGEKSSVNREWVAIYSELAGLQNQAGALGVDSSNYRAAYDALANYLVTLSGFNDFTVDTNIDGPAFRADFANYYAAKQALINAMAAKAATTATWAGTAGPGKPADNATNGAVINRDPNFTSPAGWTVQINSGGGLANFGFPTGANGAAAPICIYPENKVGTGDAAVWAQDNTLYTISPSRTYELAASIFADAGNARTFYLAVCFYDYQGNYIGSDVTGWGGAWSGYPIGNLSAVGNMFTHYAGSFGAGTTRAIPAGATQCRVGVILNYGASGLSGGRMAAQDLKLTDTTAVVAAGQTALWSNIAGQTNAPASNATVGANLNSNVTGSINDTNAPSLVTVSSVSKLTNYLGTFRTGTSGARSEMSDGGVKVVSTSGAIIRMGSSAL